jgi:hypothetical protein
MNTVLLCVAQGLEDQLLAEVVRQERPELEEQRDRLVVSMAADKQQLQELEVGAGCCLSECGCVHVGCELHRCLVIEWSPAGPRTTALHLLLCADTARDA